MLTYLPSFYNYYQKLLSYIAFLGFLLLALLMTGDHAYAVSGVLSFEPSSCPFVEGYKVYYGTNSRSYEHVIDIGDKTHCEISGLKPQTVYYFAATAYDSFGRKSDYSTELAINTPIIDADGDGLSDSDETDIYATDPQKSDSDGDGISDQEELDYWGTDWNGDVDQDGIINLLDSDSDGDLVCDGTEIMQGYDPADPEDNQATLPRMAFAEIPVDHYWHYIRFEKSFQDPVVVAAPLSSNDQDPALTRIRNVDSNGFEIKVQEYDYQDGKHSLETVNILVMEKGNYLLADGTHIEVNSFETDNMNLVRQMISFAGAFDTQPVTLSSIQTFNGPAPATGRISNVSSQGFDYSLQIEEYNLQNDHPRETVGYIAWEPSAGNSSKTNYKIAAYSGLNQDSRDINYNHSFSAAPVLLAAIQTRNEEDTATIRYTEKTSTGFKARIEEEKSLDNEMSHANEDIGFIALSNTGLEQVIDNLDNTFSTTGNWEHSLSVNNYYQQDYQYAPRGDGYLQAAWTFEIGTAGRYEILAHWTDHSNRATDAPYQIYNNGNLLSTIQVDQTKHGGKFNPLGSFLLQEGTVEIRLSNEASGYVIADALKIKQKSDYLQSQSLVDNKNSQFATNSNWSHSTSVKEYYNKDYQHAAAGDGSQKATWSFEINSPGKYEIFAHWTAHSNRATNAPYQIYNNDNLLTTIKVDQTRQGGKFNTLGSFPLDNGSVQVSLNNNASGYVIADAVKVNLNENDNTNPDQKIVDNADWTFSTNSNWNHSTSVTGYYNNDYQYASSGDGSMQAVWNFEVSSTGLYEILARWTDHSNRAPDAPYYIYNNDNLLTVVTVDQTEQGGKFNTLGAYSLNKGTVQVRLTNDANGYVIADAAKISPME